ncbi:Mycothiol S-conjugate amidase [Planctomycetes bacterium Poly30]|uniref:Mycothiol S-conjugate amidase n=1 Tax=Saltatorellus ferox TaxID=2528018 RepID=A0A518EPK4_9BACT|nr:Mycothiol S-conjugate amidase [Planctomycetes bacterium Poly30]
MPAFLRRIAPSLSLFAACVACSLLSPARAAAQRPPEQLNSGEILHRMQKLGVVGSVLYLAAHPDDENTRLISYLSNGAKVRTAYLSLTRGDGGQNLIGPELGPGLGVIRTQELMEARRVDGGEQFFSRAVDFGYSKSPEEALAKWGKREILSDVVRVVRTFRPDVIVTRFDVDGSGGHGHHTASALLAREAFALAADPDAFPEQIAEGLRPWRTTRLFFNASTWWSLDVRDHALADPEHWATVEVGGYDSLLGMSYNEIAGRARSQHRSQGFGSALRRGSEEEYLRLDLGAPLAAREFAGGIFTGIDLTWNRIEGGAEIGAAIDAMVAAYDPLRPEKSFEALSNLGAKITAALVTLDPASADAAWMRRTLASVHDLLQQVTGTAIEARAARAMVARGETLATSIVATQRIPGDFFELISVTPPRAATRSVGETVPWNTELEAEVALETDANTPIDQPYWLANPFGTLYDPSSTGHVGIEPISRSGSVYRADLRVKPVGRALSAERVLMHTWVERVDGQRSRPAVVTPVASIEPADPVVVVTGDRAEISVEVRALCDGLSGSLGVDAPTGWTVVEQPSAIEGLARGDRRRFEIQLERTVEAVNGALRLSFEGPLGETDRTQHVIDYPHIVPQVWYSAAEVRLVPLDVEVSVQSVGYVNGAGDEVASALRRIGVTVEIVDPEKAEPEDLARFDAVVIGIRAYNAVPGMARLQPMLMDYVKAGGTMVVQYNTASRDMMTDPRELGPLPFSLTRGRVTVEEAAPTFLLPDHPLMNEPNRLTAADFDGWVQERGLYFAGDLDPGYEALIAWNDPGEAPLSGALIACDFGEGRFLYTGISLFRQLPAGVPGAYRLLANLLVRRAER